MGGENNLFNKLFNLLQPDSITIPLSLSLAILKRAPSSVQAFGNPGVWFALDSFGILWLSNYF